MDLPTNGDEVSLFVDHRVRQVLHLRFRVEDLKKIDLSETTINGTERAVIDTKRAIFNTERTVVDSK